MNTDPIADMLTRIRNAIQRRIITVDLPHSRLKAEIGRLLTEQGYLDNCEVSVNDHGRKTLNLTLKYSDNIPAIEGLTRISKPGQRIYDGSRRINRLTATRTGDLVISTTQGVLTGRQAKKAGLGGEILFRIW